MFLLDLPHELLLEIWDTLETAKELNAFVQTCRYTYDNFNHRLYQFAAQTPHWCHPLQWAAMKGPEATTRKLLDAGVDPKKSWSLALSHAARRGRLGVLNMLLEHGFDTNETDGFSRTPLHRASLHGHVEIVRALLDAGADLRAKDDDGCDALWSAVIRGHAAVLSLLLERGMPVNGPIQGQDIPLVAAARYGYEDVVNTLLDAGADLEATDGGGANAVHGAAGGGNPGVVALLLDKGATLDTRDRHGRTPLYRACSSRHPHVDVVKILLQRGVDVDVRVHDGGRTPLAIAATLGFTDAVDPLLEQGADPTAADDDGCTPLALATRYGHAGTVLALLDNETQKSERYIDKPDNRNRTPLFLATLYGHEHIVRILLNRGSAAIETPTSAGRTPFSFASNHHQNDETLHPIWKWLTCPSETSVDLVGVEAASEKAKCADVDVRCDRCEFPISPQDTHFHCGICHADDFDLCLECFSSGATCLDATHTLEKTGMVDGKWRAVSDEVIYQMAMTVAVR